MDQHREGRDSVSSRDSKPPTPASWKPGQSGNPRGRPRKGSALAEAIRAKCDPENLATIALTIAEDAKEQPSVRLQALHWLSSSGYVKPEAKLEITAGEKHDEPDLSALTEAELARLVELETEREALLAGTARPLPEPEPKTNDPACPEDNRH